MPPSPSHRLWLRRREHTSIPATCLLLWQRQEELAGLFWGHPYRYPGEDPPATRPMCRGGAGP